jgi:hypothetical protein
MYNQLPSTVLREGTTFDIMVADIYTTWEKHKMNPDDPTMYNEDQLAEMIKGVKG